jgi:hypothetical protein
MTRPPIYPLAGRSLCFQFSSLLIMWHWFYEHVNFTLSGNFCIRMAAVRAQQPGMGNCTGRADNIKVNTNQEDLLIQEYCIPTKMSKLFQVSKVAKCLLVQVSEATVKPPQRLLFNCVLGAASHHQESFPAPAASLAASAPAPPWLPQSWSLAAAASCCRAISGTAAGYS